jgi:hypothetical protein
VAIGNPKLRFIRKTVIDPLDYMRYNAYYIQDKNMDSEGAGMTNIIEIFDPPMCCPGGLCGPAIDPALLDVSEALLKLKNELGIEVPRYLLQQNGQKFMGNPEILGLLREKGTDFLPAVTVNEKVVKQKGYPTFDELLSYAGDTVPAGAE